MTRVAFLALFAVVALATECVVKRNGYVDFCTEGEVCTSVGCRCLPRTECHHANDNRTFCGELNTCDLPDGTRQCCRSGEHCVANVGCRCMNHMCEVPACTGACLEEAMDSLMPHTMINKLNHRLNCWQTGECARIQATMNTTVGIVHECTDGSAFGYPCSNVDLYAHLDFVQLGCANSMFNNVAEGNDIWGWTTKDGKGYERHFALVGCTTGTSFVDITEPLKPQVIGYLPTPSTPSSWRDIKTYKHYAFIVTEARNSGMQVFDLNHLLNVQSPGPGHIFSPDAWYTDMMGSETQRSTHNIVINEATALAALVGCKTCSGGLLFVDISNPLNPQYAGCFSQDGYVHDAQCVMYNKPSYPDEAYMNRQICFCFNEDTFTIVDATNPAQSVMISRTPYPSVKYCHQGWATPDMYYLLSDDEQDEQYRTTPDKTQYTVTYLWAIENLGRPEQIGYFQSPEISIDHNQYIYDTCSYQANYASGLRILRLPVELGMPGAKPELVGYFDVDPNPAHGASYYGAWSVYANFGGLAKNIVVVDSIEQGLFILHVDKKKLGCEGV